jgi:hypothetical protein
VTATLIPQPLAEGCPHPIPLPHAEEGGAIVALARDSGTGWEPGVIVALVRDSVI